MKLSEIEATEYVKTLEFKHRNMDYSKAKILDTSGKLKEIDKEIMAIKMKEANEIKEEYKKFICEYFEIINYPEEIKNIIIGMAYDNNELDTTLFEGHFWNMTVIVPDFKKIIQWAENKNEKI